MTTTAIYARTSNGRGIEGQVLEAKRYARERGWAVAEAFLDDGISGNADGRPGFERMTAAAKAGEFDTVIVSRRDRLARSRELAEALEDQLRSSGARWVFVSESKDDRSANNRDPASFSEHCGDWRHLDQHRN